ncbi:glycosyltransferase [Pseudoalteromonas spongiae]|uniref:glycosyltransferase n=1 Tax=Pseudoalteromonas spongiae TaxID=298657 RepID=UPI000C2D0DEF|nr:glycosyltransferase [Pseudoalteromonas spongiae]
MKHIAIYVPQFPVASETFVVTEIEALRAAGHKVSVITMEHLDHESDFDFDVFELKRERITTTLKGLCCTSIQGVANAYKAASSQHAIRNLSLLYFGLQINYLIKKQQISHIHCHFMHSSLAYGIIAAKYAGISVSSVGHGHDVYVNANDLNAKLAFCDFNVAVCQDMYNLLRNIKTHSVHLLHCGVDVNKFQHYENPNNSTVKLLFVGRLVDKKGIEFALNALSDIPPSKRPQLDIIGSGPKLAELVDLVNQLHLNNWVRFLGQRTSSEIIALSKQYDAFIAPFCIADNGDKDTGPVVLKEAMAMGLPTITTNIMGCTEIVDGSCGYTVPSRDSDALKQAILTFCQLPENERIKMRNAARDRVNRHFNATKQGVKLSRLIEQVAYES